MLDKIKFKCHWHDFYCESEVLCNGCPHMPKGEDKPNYNKPRKRAELDGWGMPICPSCNEPTYDEKRCMLCGQAFKLDKYLPKPLIVGWKGWKGVFVSRGYWLYDDKGKFVCHAQSAKKIAPNEARKQLKTMLEVLKILKEREINDK